MFENKIVFFTRENHEKLQLHVVVKSLQFL